MAAARKVLPETRNLERFFPEHSRVGPGTVPVTLLSDFIKVVARARGCCNTAAYCAKGSVRSIRLECAARKFGRDERKPQSEARCFPIHAIVAVERDTTGRAHPAHPQFPPATSSIADRLQGPFFPSDRGSSSGRSSSTCFCHSFTSARTAQPCEHIRHLRHRLLGLLDPDRFLPRQDFDRSPQSL